MATRRKDEDRVLDREEKEMVDATRHPGIGDMETGDLTALAKRLRDRRDRAQDLTRRRRGEARRGGGGLDAKPQEGLREKAAILAEAMARVNKERARRED